MSSKEGNVIKLFVISALLAAFAFNLFLLNEADYEINDIMVKICNFESFSQSKELIPYVLLKRIKQVFVIYVLLRAFKSEIVIDVISIAFGVFIGMLITAQTFLNGINGLIMLVLCFIPHYPIYIYLIKNLYNLNRCSMRDKAFWGFLFMSVSVFCIGVICECFFSIFFLKEFYQHIVMHLA